MRFLGARVGIVVALAGCHTGGTLTGAGGGGQLSGLGGNHASGSGSGGAGVILGSAGAGPLTGAAGYPGTSCGAVMVPVEHVPPNIAIVLDTSASMNDAPDGSCTGSCGVASKWNAAVSGIDTALASTGPSVNWGLEFIGGEGDNCYIGGIAVAVAPKSGASIMAALANRTAAGALAVAGSTPTRVAVNAAFDHLRGLTVPGNQGIVLLSDGEPDCNMAAPGAVDLPATLDAVSTIRAYGVPTVVLGVGRLDGATDYALSMMAIEGGLARSDRPVYYPVADAQGVVTAMNDFARTIGSCTFAVPPPPNNDGTQSRADISVLLDGQATPYDPIDGWSFTDATYTAFNLYGKSCEAVQAGTVRQVSIVFRCNLI